MDTEKVNEACVRDGNENYSENKSNENVACGENLLEAAVQRHKKGYNCAQAVVCTYCDRLGIDEETAFRLSEGFGGGMGGMRDGTCGAVTGLYMLAGLKNSSGGVENGVTKKETYDLVKKLAEEFKVMNTSVICGDLLGVKGQPKLRSCDGCIEDACLLAEKFLFSEEDCPGDTETEEKNVKKTAE